MWFFIISLLIYSTFHMALLCAALTRRAEEKNKFEFSEIKICPRIFAELFFRFSSMSGKFVWKIIFKQRRWQKKTSTSEIYSNFWCFKVHSNGVEWNSNWFFLRTFFYYADVFADTKLTCKSVYFFYYSLLCSWYFYVVYLWNDKDRVA